MWGRVGRPERCGPRAGGLSGRTSWLSKQPASSRELLERHFPRGGLRQTRVSVCCAGYVSGSSLFSPLYVPLLTSLRMHAAPPTCYAVQRTGLHAPPSPRDPVKGGVDPTGAQIWMERCPSLARASLPLHRPNHHAGMWVCFMVPSSSSDPALRVHCGGGRRLRRSGDGSRDKN